MSNMSYCRFSNTLSDLRDCRWALEALFSGAEDARGLPREELQAAKELCEECVELASVLAEEQGRDIDLDDVHGDIGETLDRAQQAAEDRAQETDV